MHRLDAADLFRRAVDRRRPEPACTAIGDEGVPFRDIAEAIGRRLGVPVTSIPAGDTGGHFGFLGPVVAHDTAASGLVTRKLLGWEPVNAGLLDDLDEGHYSSR